MITVKQLLKEKTGCVLTIAPQDSVYSFGSNGRKNMGALVVVEDGKVVGIFLNVNTQETVILKGKSSKATSSKDLMNNKVCYVRPEQTVSECMALFTENVRAICLS